MARQPLTTQSLGTIVRSKPLLLQKPFLMDYYKNHLESSHMTDSISDSIPMTFKSTFNPSTPSTTFIHQSSQPQSQRLARPGREPNWMFSLDEQQISSPSLHEEDAFNSDTLAPPPYLLNILTKWPTTPNVDQMDSQNDHPAYVISSATSQPSFMNDQKRSSDTLQSSPLSTTDSDVDNNSNNNTVTVPDLTWFERLRAKWSGYTPTSTPTLSPANISQNRLQYYSDYDVMMGIRIAISLSSIISLFALFITYKSYCNARKQRLRAANPISNPATGQDSTSSGPIGLTGSFSRSSRRSRSVSAAKASQ